MELLYEGKGKKIFSTTNPQEIRAFFKDDLTAFNAQKRGKESQKGALNCQITSALFELLHTKGIKTHYIRQLNDNEILCHKVQIIPIEVVVRNVATGSLTKRLGIPEGQVLHKTLIEFYYKNDSLGDPLINDEHAILLQCVQDVQELEVLRKQARAINTALKSFFLQKNLKLIDFKLEFGKDSAQNIILADEITPDSCRFWDKESNEKLDKDRFRQGLGDVKMAYQEVLKRILQ